MREEGLNITLSVKEELTEALESVSSDGSSPGESKITTPSWVKQDAIEYSNAFSDEETEAEGAVGDNASNQATEDSGVIVPSSPDSVDSPQLLEKVCYFY